MNTMGSYYDMSWLAVTSYKYYLTFEVESCSSHAVLLALSETPGRVQENTIEISIRQQLQNNNTTQDDVITIRKGVNGKVLASGTTPDSFVKCGEYKPFWVAWNDRAYRVGRGKIAYQDKLIEYKDKESKYFIHGISVASHSYIHWRTDQNTGMG